MRDLIKSLSRVHAAGALAAIGVATACVGIALIYLPAALIIGGFAAAAYAVFVMDVKQQ